MCFLMVFNCIFLLSELVLCVSAIYPSWGEWQTLDKIDPLVYPSKKMWVQRSSRLTARLEEDAQEEAVATTMWTCSSIWPTYGAKQRCSPDCWSSPWSFWTGGRRRRQRRQMVEGEDMKERIRQEDQRQLYRAAKMQNQERPPTRSTTTLKANHNRRDNNSSLHITTQGTGIPREANWIGIRPLKPKDVHRVQESYNQIERILKGVPRIENNGKCVPVDCLNCHWMEIYKMKNNISSMIARSPYQVLIQKA